MSNTKTYIVTASFFSDAGVTLLVDHDVLTPELATEINTFWSGASGRLREENGDVVCTVVRMFGAAAIRYFMNDGGARFAPSSEDSHHWTAEVLKAQMEGWPDLDGLGILILSAQVDAVDYDDVLLEAT